MLTPPEPLYRVSYQGMRQFTGGLYVSLQEKQAHPEVGKHVQQDIKITNRENERN
jgi:hypothetical protein